MPNKFHGWQMIAAFTLAVLFAVLYYFAPREKAETLAGLASLAVGFVVGKFSNGFPKAGPNYKGPKGHDEP